LIDSYATASAQQCKCGCFSLPQYRKRKRSLFTATLEHTSNVLTAGDVGRSSGRVRRRACGFLVPGIRSVIASPFAFPPVFRRVCTAPETRPLPAVSRARDVDRLSSGVQWEGRGRRSPGPSSAIALPGYAPPIPSLPGCFATFRACHRRLCRSSAGGDGVPQQPGTASETDRPIAPSPLVPPPAIQLRSRR